MNCAYAMGRSCGDPQRAAIRLRAPSERALTTRESLKEGGSR